MQTSGLHILKTLCIFGLLAGIGIMEAISAAASDSVEQEVCECAGSFGVLCVSSGSRKSYALRARTTPPRRSPVVSNKSLGHGDYFIQMIILCGF